MEWDQSEGKEWCSPDNKELATTWAPSPAANPAAKAAFRQEMGINSLANTPTNEPEPVC